MLRKGDLNLQSEGRIVDELDISRAGKRLPALSFLFKVRNGLILYTVSKLLL